MLARQYSIMEVRNLLNTCEGRGPGVGGHALAEHGHLRDDVTDRNKPNDSAFQKESSMTVPVATIDEKEGERE
jgi:hypothetical protein